MGVNDISFPGLGIHLHNVPKSFQVFGFEIALYGVVIGIGLLAAFALVLRIARKEGLDPEMFWDYIIYVVIFGIIGARAYYVIFNWDYYSGSFMRIIDIRGGGMAIYGSVIAGVVTTLIYCKLKKKNPFAVMDVAVFGLILGQIIGRYANFFNRECFGDYSGGLLRMYLPVSAVRANEITDALASHTVMVGDTQCISVHPTFLYESLLNLVVLILMLIYRKHKRFKGELLLCYLGGYGIVRFFVEGLRTDQLKWFGTDVAVSQVLGILLFAGSVIADIVVRIILSRRKTGDTVVQEK